VKFRRRDVGAGTDADDEWSTKERRAEAPAFDAAAGRTDDSANG